MFHMFVYFCMQHCSANVLVGVISPRQLVLLLIWKPVDGSVRLVHPRTWFKPPVSNCFATDRSKAVTPRVLTFDNCLWRIFFNWLLYNHALFSSLLFGWVRRLCLLNLAISYMHISPLFCLSTGNLKDYAFMYDSIVVVGLTMYCALSFWKQMCIMWFISDQYFIN
jgi:hypothetical protein